MVAKPVEKLNRLIGYMIVGFVTAGILLFGILTSLSVKGRKREIGILLSMGEHRKRILGQFVLENLVPVLIALVFAALCATPTAEYFADRMISNQAEKVEQENEDLSGNIKNALPTSEIAAYESTGVTVDTDLSIEWNWKIMTGMILGILDLFLLILILQVGKITRKPGIYIAGQKVGVHEEKKNDNDRSDGSGAGMAGRRFCSGIWNDTGFATGRLAPRGRLPV